MHAEGVLQLIQRSCQELVAASSEVVTIDTEKVTHLASSLPPTDVKASATYTRPPIRFTDIKEELDYMCLACLLDFGSGYDPLLASKGCRDARESVEFGLLGLAMQGSLPGAQAMIDITRWQVSVAFGIDASEEKEVMPGVTMTSPGPLNPFLAKLQVVLNDTGRVLLENGHSSFGEWVISQVDARKAAGLPPSAGVLVESLGGTFPAFDDRSQGSQGIPLKHEAVFMRKAQELAGKLHARFAKTDDRFAFEDIHMLTGESDDVAVAMLRQRYGVLKIVSPELESAIEQGTNLSSSDSEDGGSVTVLRAAAVEAARQICEAASGAFSPYQLGLFMARQARADEGEWKALKRHVETETVAY